MMIILWWPWMQSQLLTWYFYIMWGQIGAFNNVTQPYFFPENHPKLQILKLRLGFNTRHVHSAWSLFYLYLTNSYVQINFFLECFWNVYLRNVYSKFFLLLAVCFNTSFYVIFFDVRTKILSLVIFSQVLSMKSFQKVLLERASNSLHFKLLKYVPNKSF